MSGDRPVAGGAGDGDPTAAPARSSGSSGFALRFSDATAGDRGELPVGDRVQIELKQSGGTGFSWFLDELPEFLVLESDSLSPGPADDSDHRLLPGAASLRTIVLLAAGSGTGAVKLALRRPWPGGETDRTLSYSVSVQSR